MASCRASMSLRLMFWAFSLCLLVPSFARAFETATHGRFLGEETKELGDPLIQGDCDGSGQVTIGELQKAINMWWGLEPIACGVDANDDGAVSIGEVQAVGGAVSGTDTHSLGPYPSFDILDPSEILQFHSIHEPVSWSVVEGPAGGAITAGGLYTAPGTPGTYHVTDGDYPSTRSCSVVQVSAGSAPAYVVAIESKTVPAQTDFSVSVSVGGTKSGLCGIQGFLRYDSELLELLDVQPGASADSADKGAGFKEWPLGVCAEVIGFTQNEMATGEAMILTFRPRAGITGQTEILGVFHATDCSGNDLHVESRSGTVSLEGCTLSCEASATPEEGTWPLTVLFDAEAAPVDCTGPVSYFWEFGDGETSPEENPIHQYAAPGSYSWTMTATVESAVTCEKTGTIDVTSDCQILCSPTASPTSGEVPLVVDFLANATQQNCYEDLRFYWRFMDGHVSALENPRHTYGQAGSYDWTVRVTADQSECTAGGTVVVVNPCEITCDASVGPPTGPAPLEVHFSGDIIAPDCDGPFTFRWEFGDGTSSAEQHPVHLFETPGAYPWTFTVEVEDVSCTQTGYVIVDEPPCAIVCSGDAPAGAVTLQEIPFTSTHTATDCIETPAVHWDFGDGATADTDTATHAYETEGTYAWTFTVTADGITCTQTGSITVEAGIPGDSDGDGEITIGEVQQAINMFLGSLPAGNGADCNGDGEISIGEVQKVINGFLGAETSC